MHELLERILETTLLLILWCSGTAAESTNRDFSLTDVVSLDRQNGLVVRHFLGKRKAAETHELIEESKHRAVQPRSYYSSLPAAPYIPLQIFQFAETIARAFDPISVLASLAFLAFLLQSFAALFDRTRSMMPTIISSRRASSSDYGEQFAAIEKRVLRSLEEYASLSNDLLDEEKESKKSSSQ